KVSVQGVVWQSKSFDQLGVLRCKVLSKRIGSDREAKIELVLAHDALTNALIKRYRAVRG
ncbi:MAG TPA: hypothetical protein VGC79_07385, partial [Polyangiaceae bacterium]